MKVITLEEHITTRKFQAIATGVGAQIAQRQPQIAERLLEFGRGRIQAMDEASVDVQILSFTGFGLYEMAPDAADDVAKDVNDQIAEAMRAFPSRFGGFAALPAQNPGGAARELERCVKDLGFQGAMLDGTVDGEFFDHPRFAPIFEAAVALDVPIYLHPAPPPAPVQEAYTGDLRPPLNFLLSTAGWGWHVETGLHCLRLMVSGLFDRLPDLKMIVGHLGENLPYSIVRSNNVLTRAGLKLERSPLEVFRQNFWITTSGYFSIPPALCAREVLGTERILLSVDYPFSQLAEAHEMLERYRSHFSPEEIQAIAYDNAAKLLKWKG